MTVSESMAHATRLRKWFGLGVLCLAALLVSVHAFVLLLAVPAVTAALGATSTQQLWILDIYGFVAAGLMITMGNLGDRIGRRRLLLAAAVVFGVASVAAAYSASPGMLIGLRAALGVAGAAIVPSALSLISTLFPDEQQRAKALGAFGGCITMGAVLGPIVGGLLLDSFWWGSAFLIGAPAMFVLLVLGPFLLPEYRNEQVGRIDVVSVVLSLSAILLAIYGLKRLASHGAGTMSVALLLIGGLLGWTFVRRQRCLSDPLVDVRLLTRRTMSVTLGSMALYAMLFGGVMVFLTQYFQLVKGMTPLKAAIALVPGMICSTIAFQLAPWLARWVRPVVLISAGIAVTAAGIAAMALTNSTSTLVVAFAIACLGGAPLSTLGTNLVMGAVPPEEAGSASALTQTVIELGFATGIAVLGSVVIVTGFHVAAGISAVALSGVCIMLARTLRALPVFDRNHVNWKGRTMSVAVPDRRITAITAESTGYQNAGMVTVDLAFESIRKRLGREVVVGWFTMHLPSVGRMRPYLREGDLPFRPQLLEHPGLPPDTVRVIWGDFLQAHHYLEQDATLKLLKHGRVTDRAAARDLLHRLLLLRDEPAESLQRTVLYGSTLLHNTQSDFRDSGYSRAFSRLVAESHAIWLRDPISVAKAGHLRDPDRPPLFGADAALLLDPEEVDALERTGWADAIEDRAAGVFVGERTETPSWLPHFCEELAARTEVRLDWLPWSETRPPRQLPVDVRRAPAMLGDLLAALPRYRFIVTDTYHLCVNAWRVGTPAVCLAAPQPGPSQDGLLTLNDWKKHVFYASYDAMDLYLSTSLDPDDVEHDVERIAGFLQGGGFEPVVARIRQHAERSRDALTSTLSSMLR
ncbi:MFS transporter [Kribbella sp.]|uniref:MFS transporter n=1 Tax=Kribbella sp. TaxID=1871183 RepID=UPI002D294E46|nr:MFS transporter [Kribbella sp.]HZX08247.1 MFS transporter [Kribbella sp.]